MLIVPRKRIWTQQPQGAAQIDWANPITKGLKFAFEASNFVDVVRGAFPTQGTLTSKSVTPAGRAAKITGSISQNLYWGSDTAAFMSGLTQYTIDITFRTNNTGNSFHLFGAWNVASGNHILVSASGTGLLWVAAEDAGSIRRRWDATGLFTAGKLHRLILVWGGGASKIMILDGFDRTAALSSVDTSATSVRPNPTAIHIGQYISGTAEDVDVVYARIWDRALSTKEAGQLAANSWHVLRAPDSRIFVPTGAGGGGGDSLTASSIIASPAEVGSPLLSQNHALTASSIDAAPAVVDSPSATQRHVLSASAVSASPAVVGLPALTEIVAGILSALPIVASPAIVGAPAITQKHALSAGAISAGPATFGTPTLAQQHALMAQGVAASATLGAPVLSDGGVTPFTPDQLLYLEANYVTIASINDIAAAVLAALQATAIPVNVKKVNDVSIKGAGIPPTIVNGSVVNPGNPWGAV